MRNKKTFFYWNFIIRNLFSILTTTRSRLSLWLEFLLSQIKCYSIYWFCQYLFWLPYSYFLFNSIVIRRFARKFFSFFLFYWKADFLFPFPRILFSSVFFARWIHTEVSLCVSICIIKVKFYFVDIGNLNCKFSLFLLTTYVSGTPWYIHCKSFLLLTFSPLHPSNGFLRYITSVRDRKFHMYVDVGWVFFCF